MRIKLKKAKGISMRTTSYYPKTHKGSKLYKGQTLNTFWWIKKK